MDPDTIREIKKRQRYFDSYLSELTDGKVSKKFKPVSIDLVQEYWETKNLASDFNKELKGIEENADEEEKEPFNLNNEREELLFDESGNLKLKRERKEATDPWLESIEKIEKIEPKNEGPEKESIDIKKCKDSLRKLLKQNETVSQAIKRLRGKIPEKKTFRKNVRKSVQNSEFGEKNESVSKKQQENNDNISEEYKKLCQICSDLIESGCHELYDWKIEDLCEVRYWKLKGPNGIVGPVDDDQIKIWKKGGKLKGFKIQSTDKSGKELNDQNWIDFDNFEIY